MTCKRPGPQERRELDTHTRLPARSAGRGDWRAPALPPVELEGERSWGQSSGCWPAFLVHRTPLHGWSMLCCHVGSGFRIKQVFTDWREKSNFVRIARRFCRCQVHMRNFSTSFKSAGTSPEGLVSRSLAEDSDFPRLASAGSAIIRNIVYINIYKICTKGLLRVSSLPEKIASTFVLSETCSR